MNIFYIIDDEIEGERIYVSYENERVTIFERFR